MNLRVTSTVLNLRSSPAIATGNIITGLPQGQLLEAIDAKATGDWWHVRATVAGRNLEGYAATRYIQPDVGPAADVTHAAIEAVHCPATPRSRRSSTADRYCLLGDPAMPGRPANVPVADRKAAMTAISDFLAVETSARYLPDSYTYCNIYAYDFACRAQVYLPRVWWTGKAIASLTAKVPVVVQYGVTVTEVRANELYQWLSDWGGTFGWSRTFDCTELQQRANDGGIGFICARRKDPKQHGHITVVLPEDSKNVALRRGAAVVAPLQSQAGRHNKRYFATDWWVQGASNFSDTGFWWHE